MWRASALVGEGDPAAGRAIELRNRYPGDADRLGDEATGIAAQVDLVEAELHVDVVAKQAQGTGVRSEVRPVSGEARVAEIARMLGGERLSSTTLAHAKEMLQSGS